MCDVSLQQQRAGSEHIQLQLLMAKLLGSHMAGAVSRSGCCLGQDPHERLSFKGYDININGIFSCRLVE